MVNGLTYHSPLEVRRRGSGHRGRVGPREKCTSRRGAPSVPHRNLSGFVSRSSANLDLDVIAECGQKAHEALKRNFGELSTQDFRQLGLGGAGPGLWPQVLSPLRPFFSLICDSSHQMVKPRARPIIPRRRKRQIPPPSCPAADPNPASGARRRLLAPLRAALRHSARRRGNLRLRPGVRPAGR